MPKGTIPASPVTMGVPNSKRTSNVTAVRESLTSAHIHGVSTKERRGEAAQADPWPRRPASPPRPPLAWTRALPLTTTSSKMLCSCVSICTIASASLRRPARGPGQARARGRDARGGGDGRRSRRVDGVAPHSGSRKRPGLRGSAGKWQVLADYQTPRNQGRSLMVPPEGKGGSQAGPKRPQVEPRAEVPPRRCGLQAATSRLERDCLGGLQNCLQDGASLLC